MLVRQSHQQATTVRTTTASQHKPHVRRLGRGLYQVESRTTPGAMYIVTLTGRDTDTCECAAYVKGGHRPCYHVQVASQISVAMRRWYAQAAATTTAAATT